LGLKRQKLQRTIFGVHFYSPKLLNLTLSAGDKSTEQHGDLEEWAEELYSHDNVRIQLDQASASNAVP